jgi:hypothetical protein
MLLLLDIRFSFEAAEWRLRCRTSVLSDRIVHSAAAFSPFHQRYDLPPQVFPPDFLDPTIERGLATLAAPD